MFGWIILILIFAIAISREQFYHKNKNYDKTKDTVDDLFRKNF